jgi:hypothetical protein
MINAHIPIARPNTAMTALADAGVREHRGIPQRPLALSLSPSRHSGAWRRRGVRDYLAGLSRLTNDHFVTDDDRFARPPRGALPFPTPRVRRGGPPEARSLSWRTNSRYRLTSGFWLRNALSRRTKSGKHVTRRNVAGLRGSDGGRMRLNIRAL